MKKLIEKIKKEPAGAICFGAVAILWLFMQLSAWQVFDNFYTCSVKMAGWGWNVTGLILSAASVLWCYRMATDSPKVTKNGTSNVIILALLVVFSFLAYMGFTTGYGCIQ
jgi:hypothetical protein